MFEYHRGLVVKKSPQSWEVNRGVNPVVMLDVHGRLLNGVQGEGWVYEGKLGCDDRVVNMDIPLYEKVAMEKHLCFNVHYSRLTNPANIWWKKEKLKVQTLHRSPADAGFFFFFFFFTGFLPCFRIFCFLYLCGSPPVNRLGPRSAVAVVVSVVMFVCSTQVRRETLGLIGVCFSKVWLLFYSCGLPLNGSASPFTTKIGGNIQAARFLFLFLSVFPSISPNSENR